MAPTSLDEDEMMTDLVPERHDNSANTQPANQVLTQQSRVYCDGGGGALGHPQIWLNLGTGGTVTCPYCSREFVRAGR